MGYAAQAPRAHTLPQMQYSVLGLSTEIARGKEGQSIRVAVYSRVSRGDGFNAGFLSGYGEVSNS